VEGSRPELELRVYCHDLDSNQSNPQEIEDSRSISDGYSVDQLS
jgi:hypothetical protein